MELQKKENILIKARELNFRFCIDNIIKDGIHHDRNIVQYRLKGWVWEEDIPTFNKYMEHLEDIGSIYQLPISVHFEVTKYFENMLNRTYEEGESLWLNKIIKDNYIELEIYFIN